MRLVDFDYIQCPLGEGQGKCHDLVLIVVKSPRLVKLPALSVTDALQAVAREATPAPAAASAAAAPSADAKPPGTKPTGKKPVAPTEDDSTQYALPSSLLQIFMEVFWRTTIPPSFEYRTDPDFLAMMRQLGASPYVRVTNSLPWHPPRTRL
jgi:hypothetical protein